MKLCKTEIKLPKFKGFKYTGEYRMALKGEYFLNPFISKPLAVSNTTTIGDYIIMIKVK